MPAENAHRAPDSVVIFGLGFTTQRLARSLRQQDIPVFAAVRNFTKFAELSRIGVELCGFTPESLPKGAVLVHSVPPLQEPERSSLRQLIDCIEPRRILYISSTGVYGAQTSVNDATPVAPNDEKGRARLDEEQWISAAHSSLILRSAAIYGPGRGVHVRLREGRIPRGNGGVVSRIHVDDLAALLEAGIFSQLQGAWPVADSRPATSAEIVAWCAELMGISHPNTGLSEHPLAGRNVDGRKIRDLLRVSLRYPSYHTGIPASLLEETMQEERRPDLSSSSSTTRTLRRPRESLH